MPPASTSPRQSGPDDAAHELQPMTARSRVRFNSAANTHIPVPPQARDAASPSPAPRDEPIADAEVLLDCLDAMTHAYDDGAPYAPTPMPGAEGDVPGSTSAPVLYQLLEAYNKSGVSTAPDTRSEASTLSPAPRPGSASGAATPSNKRKWYNADKAAQSQETLATLIGASAKLANPNDASKDAAMRPRHHKRVSSGGLLAKVVKAKEERDVRIKVHVANVLKRQQYIIKMCRALMLFGAPTHRLEEYLATTAKVLEINSQFLYIPGCMIISFDSHSTMSHVSEVKMVRTAQGVNLGKLKDTHEIYKEVLHDVIDLDEALARLDTVINAKDRHPVWLTVIMYGLASAAVSVFFQARLIDMPVILALGCLLGLLQLVISPLSKTYSTVFEISATILMSFFARAFGSIHNGNLFCFSAIAQSAIAMILPGWVGAMHPFKLQSIANHLHSSFYARLWNCSRERLSPALSDSFSPSSTPSFSATVSQLAPQSTAPSTPMPQTRRSARTH